MALFADFDTDHDQKVDALELLTACVLLGEGGPDEKLDVLFPVFDFSGACRLDFDETNILVQSACCGMAKAARSPAVTEEEVLEICGRLFDGHNLPQGGQVTKEQVARWLHADVDAIDFFNAFRGTPMLELGSGAAARQGFLVVFVGAPASGKGTICRKLVAEFGFEHLSSGDLLRARVREGGELALEAKRCMDDGGLVPDDIVVEMVMARLEALSTSRVLLDGFPRTLAQVDLLGSQVSVDLAVNLAVPREEIVTRVSKRWIHLPSGRTYNYDYHPPKEDGRDDVTGEELVQREDDAPGALRERLDVYEKETQPILQYYKAAGLLVEFDGSEHEDLVAQGRRSDAIYAGLKQYVERLLGKRGP